MGSPLTAATGRTVPRGAAATGQAQSQGGHREMKGHAYFRIVLAYLYNWSLLQPWETAGI